MDEKLDEICRYLRGHKLLHRSDDTREFASYLEQVIQPQLDELAALKAKKSKDKAVA